jgi:hypothetical protein
MTKLEQLLRSRKFWAAAAGLLFVLLKAYLPNLPFSEDQLTQWIAILAAYILGTALEDGLALRAR